MKSPIATVISRADVAGRFPSETDLATVQEELERAAARLEAAEKLAVYHDAIVRDAADSVLPRYTSSRPPGATAVASQDTVSQGYREIDRYLRAIHYCLVVGSPTPLTEAGLPRKRSGSPTLPLPLEIYVAALEYLRDRAYAGLKLSPPALVELRFYLEYAISGFNGTL
ncbi:bleomycin hydrolase [Baaleninema sp.]|uniref:bleomycin hydrolase n=1 Tax=Baaleninema sp. TaxID=3101197 RepID=UPI003D0034CA